MKKKIKRIGGRWKADDAVKDYKRR